MTASLQPLDVPRPVDAPLKTLMEFSGRLLGWTLKTLDTAEDQEKARVILQRHLLPRLQSMAQAADLQMKVTPDTALDIVKRIEAVSLVRVFYAHCGWFWGMGPEKRPNSHRPDGIEIHLPYDHRVLSECLVKLEKMELVEDQAGFLQTWINDHPNLMGRSLCYYPTGSGVVPRLKQIDELPLGMRPSKPIPILPGWFKCYRHVDEIYLDGWGIYLLPSRLDQLFPYLTLLGMRNNQITSMVDLRFPQSLEQIDFDHNLLTTKQGENLVQIIDWIHPLQKLKRVSLNGNALIKEVDGVPGYTVDCSHQNKPKSLFLTLDYLETLLHFPRSANPLKLHAVNMVILQTRAVIRDVFGPQFLSQLLDCMKEEAQLVEVKEDSFTNKEIPNEAKCRAIQSFREKKVPQLFLEQILTIIDQLEADFKKIFSQKTAMDDFGETIDRLFLGSYEQFPRSPDYTTLGDGMHQIEDWGGPEARKALKRCYHLAKDHHGIQKGDLWQLTPEDFPCIQETFRAFKEGLQKDFASKKSAT